MHFYALLPTLIKFSAFIFCIFPQPNRNTLKPLKYPLAATIIARNKRFLLTEFYQGIRMQSREADVFSGACLDTDSLQKRMSLQALISASNGSRNSLKLILLFCNYDMLLYLVAALIRFCQQGNKAFSDFNIETSSQFYG